jgi:hypothetical protein
VERRSARPVLGSTPSLTTVSSVPSQCPLIQLGMSSKMKVPPGARWAKTASKVAIRSASVSMCAIIPNGPMIRGNFRPNDIVRTSARAVSYLPPRRATRSEAWASIASL